MEHNFNVLKGGVDKKIIIREHIREDSLLETGTFYKEALLQREPN